jgi:type II secretory pathway pseudopilin PulG
MPPRMRLDRQSAFTMVEIALCIAVVGIAMVAIIGVLPAGLGVQQQNREETIINHDASILIEAIRGGAVSDDDLLNYVDYVAVSRAPISGSSGFSWFYGPWFKPISPPAGGTPLIQAADSATLPAKKLVGLLSLPKYDAIRAYDSFYDPNYTNAYTNTVVAQFRAFSGPLSEKPLVNSASGPAADKLDLAFRYLVTVEIAPLRAQPLPVPTDGNPNPGAGLPVNLRESTLRRSLYDVALTFQWPVFGNEIPARTGANVRTFRTQVEGRLIPIYEPDPKTGKLNPIVVIGSSPILPRRFQTGPASPYAFVP